LWNFDTLTCIKTLNGHEHTVSFVEFSPDGTLLYSASRDKSIRVWDVTSGNCKKTFNGHNDWVRCLSINTQGNLLASSSDDESILVWNVESSQQMYSLTGHENKIEHIVFVKNQIALQNIYTSDYVEQFNKALNGEEPTQADSNLTNLIDLNKQLLEKTKLKEKINKEYIISASRDKSIKIWDVYGSSCIYTLLGHDNWVRCLIIHPNGKYMISSSDDKTIRVWELKTGRIVKKIPEAHDRFVVSLAINHKYPLMASGSNDQTIKIWDCK
jgi:platelet-activating factor acetylhydrolase IB subunit alpha